MYTRACVRMRVRFEQMQKNSSKKIFRKKLQKYLEVKK